MSPERGFANGFAESVVGARIGAYTFLRIDAFTYSMKTTTTTEAAKMIRQEVKAKLGANQKQVSVRCSAGSIDVTVKDATVNLDEVRAIAMAFESVDRDSATGEILCGGNRFVRVEYSDAALAPVVADLLPAIAEIEDDSSAQVHGLWVIRYERYYYSCPSANVRCYGAEHCARQIAVAMCTSKIKDAA